MAATSFTPISLYYSSTASNVPTAGNLVAGELAINTNDGKLFYKDSSGVVQVLATKATTAGTFTTVTTSTLTSPAATALTIQSAGTTAMTIDSSGNVGIGTSSPTGKLDVSGFVRAINYLPVPTTGTGVEMYYVPAGTQGYIGAYDRAAAQYKPLQINGSTLVFGTSTAATEAMRIDSTGNVGIGTSSPAGKLDVSQSTAGVARHYLRNTNSGTGSYTILDLVNDSGNNIGEFFCTSSTNTSAFGTNATVLQAATSNPLILGTNGTERMRIDSSGNLLVGTTSNPYTAKVACVQTSNGTIMSLTGGATTALTQIAFVNPNGLVGSVTTSASLTLYNTTSDYRLKNVIGAIADSGQRIDALEPIEYDFKTGGRTRGFLAHKFAEVYPSSVSGEKDAVDEEGNPVYQAMQASTSEVMADLIAEIQSLRKRLTALESK